LLQPDVIKLGRGLIAEIDTDSSYQDLVADLVEFGRQTGAVVSATGFETAPERAMLGRLGVTAGQGHLMGRPTSDITEWARWAVPASTPERPRLPTAGQAQEGATGLAVVASDPVARTKCPVAAGGALTLSLSLFLAPDSTSVGM
jgi:hypothetical protein